MKVGRSTVVVKRDSGCGRVEKCDRNAIVHHNSHKHCHTSERAHGRRMPVYRPPRAERRRREWRDVVRATPTPRPIGHRHAATSMHCTCNITQQITDDDHQLPASARSATQSAPQDNHRPCGPGRLSACAGSHGGSATSCHNASAMAACTTGLRSVRACASPPRPGRPAAACSTPLLA